MLLNDLWGVSDNMLRRMLVNLNEDSQRRQEAIAELIRRKVPFRLLECSDCVNGFHDHA
jgi:hypothetical protein